MAIPQTDGSGRGISAHAYPRARVDGKFEVIEVAGHTVTRCRKTKQQVKIVGNRVTYVARGKGIETL